MRLLVHCTHYPVASGRYMVDAFKRLGHEVYHIGEDTGRRIWGLELPERYVWQQEPPPGGWEPDLAILMDTAYQWHHPTAPTVVYSVDNHVRDVRQPGILRYFLAHRDVSAIPWRGADMTHLPCAYDPTVFTPSPIPWAERAYDVAMIGVMYPQRWEAVQQMRAAGLKVIAGTGLVFENMAAAYQNSRISLCLSAVGDVGQRVFESAACGCVVLSDECADFGLLGAQFLYQVGYDETFAEAAGHILDRPDEAIAQIDRQLAWVAPHTWDARAREIAMWAEVQS